MGASVAVTGHHPETVSVEREQVVEIRPEVADAPQLSLARAKNNHGVDDAIDRADGVLSDVRERDASVFDLEILEQQQAFRQMSKCRERIQESVDDQRS